MLLGIDLGTTAVKALLLTPDGEVAGAAEAPVPTLPGGPGEHEQEPAAWWDAVCSALAGLSDLSRVTAVGLSGHTHGLLLVGADGAPVRPCLTWADQRPVAEARELSAAVGGRVRSRCGNPVIGVFTAPKLLWVARHEPEALAAAWRLVLPKDWLRWRLTGGWATDPTDAGSTLLWDMVEGDWDAELVGAALDGGGAGGATGAGGGTAARGSELLPAVMPSAAVGGVVTAAAARETGLPVGVPVAVGASDVACAALGSGADEAGIAYVNIGTAAQLMTPVSSLSRGPAYTFAGAGRAPLLAMTSVFSAGHALDWLTELLEPDGPAHGADGAGRHAALEASVARVPRGARGLLFLPHLLGASTPQPDARVRAGFLGLTPAHGRDELRRAVIEGVAMAVRGALDALPDEGGGARRVRLGGGPSRSGAWTRILADALGSSVEVLAAGSSPVGAAMLGGLAAGTFADPADAIARCVRVRERIEPDADAAAFYDDRRALAARAFEALAPFSHELGDEP